MNTRSYLVLLGLTGALGWGCGDAQATQITATYEGIAFQASGVYYKVGNHWSVVPSPGGLFRFHLDSGSFSGALDNAVVDQTTGDFLALCLNPFGNPLTGKQPVSFALGGAGDAGVPQGPGLSTAEVNSIGRFVVANFAPGFKITGEGINGGENEQAEKEWEDAIGALELLLLQAWEDEGASGRGLDKVLVKGRDSGAKGLAESWANAHGPLTDESVTTICLLGDDGRPDFLVLASRPDERDPVPAPATVALVLSGLGGMLGAQRLRRV